MFDDRQSFITRAFLLAEFALDYRAYTAENDAELLKRLRDWDGRLLLSETQAEGAFTQTFFVDTWGYGEAGRVSPEEHTIIAKFPVAGEGASGGVGEADLALGWFRGRKDAIPQVLCEFKDIRSKLDAKQNRKGSTRSPVEQCLNYVRGARRGLFGNEPVQPWWGLVTDMNEFRLYWWDRARAEYIRFFIRREDLLSGGYDLLSESEEARFDRYLFSRLFAREMLLSEAGRPLLLRLVERQWAKGRKLEGEFYDRYKDVRDRLYNVLRLNNPDFPGRLGELLRLTQKLLDRFIFAFFCEDMGERMLFPPQMLKDFLRSRSIEPFYDENGSELYERDAHGAMCLIPRGDMEMRFPRAWAHLRRWEQDLRDRESSAFDDDAWYRFGRNQNLDKQDVPKLIVAQTVPEMRVCADYDGTRYLNNVRVNGILPATAKDQMYLLSVLNGPVADFVFRQIGKPKQGGWYEANRQFIAPLPIPNTSPESRIDIAARARRLQERWTHRRHLLQEAGDRLSVVARARHPARWLWPDLPDLPEMTKRAPKGLPHSFERRKWAEERLDEMEAARVEALQAALNRGGRRQVRFEDGELRLYASGTVVLDRIYLDEAAGRLTESYWRWLLLSGPAREAERFAADLRRPPAPSDAPAAAQFIERVSALAEEVAAIEIDERALNETLYNLYRLSPDERNLVENEQGRRKVALAGG